MPVNQKPVYTVLMCVADERTGPAMVTLSSALGGPDAAERLYALHLIKPDDRASFFLSQERTDTASDDHTLAPLLERAASLAISVKPLSFVSGEPAVDICHVAEAKHADFLLLGWRKPLIGRSALSGTVYEVMKRAPADVGVLVGAGVEWGLEERLFGLHPERMIHACPVSLVVVRQHGDARAACAIWRNVSGSPAHT